MAQFFLGHKLNTPVNFPLRVTGYTTRSVDGTPDYSEEDDAQVRVTNAIEPDFQGEKNLWGTINAHMRKHKTNIAFSEVCPQGLGTLAAGQAARTVNAKVDAGSSIVRASGGIEGLNLGRFINFADKPRLYMVIGVDTDTNDIELDIPLEEDLARHDAINFTPTSQWHWTDEAYNDPPSFLYGANSGVGWLLDVIEAT